jgi:hypothetical protein
MFYRHIVNYILNHVNILIKSSSVNIKDVFAQNEFDLMNFTDIEDVILTAMQGRLSKECGGHQCVLLEKKTPISIRCPGRGLFRNHLLLGPRLRYCRKKDSSMRWCNDYRAINEKPVNDVFPLPLIDDCLDTLSGSVWFS